MPQSVHRPYLATFFAVAALALSHTEYSSAADHELHGANDVSITYNDIQGPGSSQSSLTRGARYLETLNLYGNGKFGLTEYSWNTGVKGTDDRQNDLKTWSLTNLQTKFSRNGNTLTLGDTFESYSQYALNTAIKGVSYRFGSESGDLPEISALYGVAYSRWDNFWGVDAVERQVYGGKLRQTIGNEFWIGFTGIATDDQSRVNNGELSRSQTYSTDWEYRPIPGLTIQGESAWISGEKSPASGTAFASFRGHAHKLVVTGDGAPSRVTLEYERVSPEFFTFVGAATPDREKFKAKWRYTYSKKLSITTAMLWYHDNLDGQRAYGTDYYKPEITMSYKRLFDRQYAVIDLSYKLDRAYSPVQKSLDHNLSIAYRDRFGLVDSDTTFGVVIYDQSGTSSRDEMELTYNTSLASRHTVGSFVLKPSVYLGGWTRNDELGASTDQIVEYSAGLGVDIPSSKISSHLKAGENRLLKDAGIDTAKTFATALINWRPELWSKMQGTLYVKAAWNDFRYRPNLAGGGQNFRESSVTGGCSLQF